MHVKTRLIGRRSLVIAMTVPLVLGIETATAAEWNLDRRLIVGVLHSDNPDQVSDAEKRAETVGQLKPALSLYRRGNNSDLLLLSELEYLKSDRDGADSLQPRVFSSLDTTVVENRLFLGTSVEVARASSGAGTVALDSLNLVDDQSNTFDFNVEPRVEVELGQLTDMSMNYTFNAFVAEGDEIDDSLTNRAGVEIDHVRPDRGYELGASFDYDHTDIDNQEPLIQRSIATSASLELSPFWQAEGSVGREWIQIPGRTEATTGPDITTENGNTWDLGLTWKPAARTSLSFGYGRRFFGERPRVELTHSTRRSRFSLSWSRDLTRSRAILADPEFTGPDDDFTDSLISGAGNGPIGPQPERVINEVAVEEQVRAVYRLRGRVSELRLEALYSREDLEFQSITSNEHNVSVRTSLTRRLGKITSVTASYQRAVGESESRYHENRASLSITLDLR